ncbi:hypothetical protein BVX99_00105 [bacterium F16]|nr:hypothetical protein BVX99_00105 [bacterium F16]
MSTKLVTDPEGNPHYNTSAYKKLFDNMLDGCAVHEIILNDDGEPVDYRFLSVNPAFEHLTGLKAENLIGKRVSEVLPATEDHWIRTYGQVALTENPIRFKNVAAELGKVFDVNSFSPEPGKFACIFQDITEQETSKQTLKTSEMELDAIYKNAPSAMLLVDHSRRVLKLNKHALEMAGRPLEQVLGLRGGDVLNCENAYKSKAGCGFSPDCECCKIQHIVAHTITTGAAYHREDAVITVARADGPAPRQLKISTQPLSELNNDVVLVCLEDVTEVLSGQQELSRLRAAIDHVAEAIMITDTEGTITYVNPSFEQITGYTSADAIGCQPGILKSGQQSQEYYAQMWTTLLSGKDWAGRLVNRRKDGTLYTEETRISPVFNVEGQLINFVSVKRDITNQVLLEKQLRQAEKMEAIGLLAGGIAHDFNNILGGILGYADLVIEDLPADCQPRQFMDQIVGASLRARDLVSHISPFSRQVEDDKKPTKLLAVVKESIQLLRALLPPSIEITLSNADESPVTVIDSSRVHEVIMNLCTNAAHAMMDRGRIEVGCRSASITHQLDGYIGPVVPGDYALISISDNGCGIPTDQLNHIFVPFFTTKDVGQGTGMGLAVVHGVMKYHKGNIIVKTQPGAGTTFELYFPQVDSIVAPPPVKDLSPLSGNERLMLVDDEMLLLDAIQYYLTKLGYSVESFRSSQKALESFQAAPDAYDCIITDQTMPQLTGMELVENIRKLRSDIPIILCTGYSKTVNDETARQGGVNDFCLKPLAMPDLTRRIRHQLDKRSVSE